MCLLVHYELDGTPARNTQTHTAHSTHVCRSHIIICSLANSFYYACCKFYQTTLRMEKSVEGNGTRAVVITAMGTEGIWLYYKIPRLSTGGSENYVENLAFSRDGRKTRAPSTQKLGRLIIFCHSDSSLPVESIHSTALPLCLPVP